MTSLHKSCPECGGPLGVGVAVCSHCGSQVGTVFSETAPPAPVAVAVGAKYRSRISATVDYYDKIEKAKEHGNNSLILSLFSFICPGIGAVCAIAAILLGSTAISTLKTHNIEEGRGPALAGVVIGAIALVAQLYMLWYYIKVGI
ncbi:MAG TPA: DUF4190 domain-containing protein [Blastocatellia bacterium]|nr:DUF4190 domain-containing protein [Blastocatellia bacterium]